MAYIINKSADTKCALSRASHDRRRDVYLLAQMGEKASRRLWDEFAAESPGQARIVVADVEMDKALGVAANKHLDRVLVKSEKKAKKPDKRTPDRRTVEAMTEREKYLRSLLDSPDPSLREGAKSDKSELGIS